MVKPLSEDEQRDFQRLLHASFKGEDRNTITAPVFGNHMKVIKQTIKDATKKTRTNIINSKRRDSMDSQGSIPAFKNLRLEKPDKGSGLHAFMSQVEEVDEFELEQNEEGPRE